MLPAYADTTVDPGLNAPSTTQEVIVVAGEDVEVSFATTLDSADVLDKKDRLKLVHYITGDAVAAKTRGKGDSGSVILTVPKQSLGRYQVRYVLKDTFEENRPSECRTRKFVSQHGAAPE